MAAFRADITDPPEDDPALLLMEEWGNKEKSLPCLAIIPGDQPDKPILLLDSDLQDFTKEQLLKLLSELP